MGCSCGSAGALDGHSPFCDLKKVEGGDTRLNRVVVGLPERVQNAKQAVGELETLIENLKQVYGQRLTLRDSEVLDRMGDLLGVPRIAGDSRSGSIAGDGCPACGPGNQTGSFCSAHKWHDR